MPDREKVMRGLECCCTHIVGMSCGNCPYEIEQREDEGISDCTSVLAYDALALLKDDETRIQYLKDHIAMCKEEVERLHNEQEAVVRCKDCVECYFASNRIQSEQTFACGKYGIDVTPDWFCADGVAKDINVPNKEDR